MSNNNKSKNYLPSVNARHFLASNLKFLSQGQVFYQTNVLQMGVSNEPTRLLEATSSTNHNPVSVLLRARTTRDAEPVFGEEWVSRSESQRSYEY